MKRSYQATPLPPLHGLGPVFTTDTRTLILSSYPGKEALDKKEYYAGTQNQFWLLMSLLLKENLSGIPYAQKLKILVSYGIGLWDVVSVCQNNAPLKTLLHENKALPFQYLKEKCPLLHKICFNGQPAGEYAPLFEKAAYATLILPSSSPSYSRQSLEKKMEIWQQIL